MIINLAIIFLLGLLFKKLFEKLNLPGLLGLIILGIIMSPNQSNLIDTKIMNISGEIRNIALVIILLRAGLGITKDSLSQLGTTTIKMSIIPGVLEGLTITISSMLLLDFTFIQGGILGFILAAVSPAVIVPSMLDFIDADLGKEQGISILILGAASIDDVVAITIFGVFLNLYFNKNSKIIGQLLNIPISIALGIGLGLLLGYILLKAFNKFNPKYISKLLIILSSALLISEIQAIGNFIKIASLLGVMALGFYIREHQQSLANKLDNTLNKLWYFAQILLFLLIGAELELATVLDAGLISLILIFIGLIARGLGVLISIRDRDFNNKERLFCVIAFIPKATVQAAIGAIPLYMGVASGNLMLTIAVLSIIITAPLGSILIEKTAPKLLNSNK